MLLAGVMDQSECKKIENLNTSYVVTLAFNGLHLVSFSSCCLLYSLFPPFHVLFLSCFVFSCPESSSLVLPSSWNNSDGLIFEQLALYSEGVELAVGTGKMSD